MEKIIDRIKAVGYEVKDSGIATFRHMNTLLLENPDKHISAIQLSGTYYIGCSSMEDFGRKEPLGKAVKVSGEEICREYFCPVGSDADWEFLKSRFEDRRTFDAIRKEKQKLSEKECSQAQTLADMEEQLGKTVAESFCCGSCGRRVFWLDTAEDIFVAYENAKKKQCGCAV